MTHIDLAVTGLLNGLWQGAILAALMGLLLRLLPRLNPVTRLTVLWLTLLAVVALPIGFVAPTLLLSSRHAISPLAAATDNSGASLEVKTQKLQGANSAETFSSPQLRHPTGESKPPQTQTEESAGSLLAKATSVRPPVHIGSGRFLGALQIVWGLLTLLMLARLAAGYRELHRLKSDAEPAPREKQAWLAGLCAKNAVRRHVRLLVSGHSGGPVSLGFRNPAILISQSLLETLSDRELEHIVLHELSHLRRRDDWTNLAQKLIAAILPIQPAIHWIGRRMSIEREMACDDWAITATGGPATQYATSLAKVAELSQWQNAGILAAGAGGKRSQLFERVRHMLDRTRNSVPQLSTGPLGVAAVVIVVSLVVGLRMPPIIAFARDTPDQTRPTVMRAELGNTDPGQLAGVEPTTKMSPRRAFREQLQRPVAQLALASSLAPMAPQASQAPESRETHSEMVMRNGLTSLTVKIDGAIEFTDDDSDVKTLSPNGHFSLEEGHFFSSRTYDVKADSSGNLTKSYSVGWSTKPMDDEARAWLRRLLPQFIRDSGVGAGPRVARILKQGGPQAVLTEIGLIHSDGSRRVYLDELFSQATLSNTQLKDAARLIRGISSDGDKAQVLIDVDTKYFTADLRPSLFEAAQSISSDGDKRRVLCDFVTKDAASDDTLVSVAKAAKRISSDGDKAEVLIDVADSYRPTDQLRLAYFDATNSISSDGDHARVLMKLLDKNSDRETVVRLLHSAEKISSDGDKARVLKQAVSGYREEDLVRSAFFDATNSISSDGDHQQVLLTLVRAPAIGAATRNEIAYSAKRISSDGDKARVLEELARTDIESARDAFFAATDSIHSDGDHCQVLITLLDKPGTSSATVVAAIQSASSISSDGDKARVLLDVADRYSKDPAISAALRKAVESIHSDGEYRAVMSEIVRGSGGN